MRKLIAHFFHQCEDWLLSQQMSVFINEIVSLVKYSQQLWIVFLDPLDDCDPGSCYPNLGTAESRKRSVAGRYFLALMGEVLGIVHWIRTFVSTGKSVCKGEFIGSANQKVELAVSWTHPETAVRT